VSSTSENRATIIVVNDDPIQAAVMTGHLEHAGYVVHEYHGVMPALQSMEQQPPPDLIVTDLHMPDIDGWRFCRLLRSPEFSPLNAVPIIIVSATYKGDDAAKVAAELGASAFLPAPIDAAAFLHVVDEVLRGEIVTPRPRVLLVDDDPVFGRMTRSIFENNGYQVDVVETGNAAIAALHAHFYDLALLDYHLPDILGDEVLAYCHKHFPYIVCVMITADQRPDLALRFMRTGAAAYVRRPCDLHYLLHVCDGARRERGLLRAEALLEQRTMELRRSAADLERQNALLEGILDNVPDVMSVKYPDLSVIRYNKAGYQLLNMSQEEVYGKKCYTLIGRNAPCLPCATLEAARTRQPASVEHYSPELEQHLHCSANPVFGSTGQVEYVVEMIRDVTARKQAEAELLQAKEAAEAANETKNRFLANMSHELRTPINGVLGMLQLLQQAELGREEREYVEVAVHSCQRLTRLLGDILDMTRLVEDVLTLHPAKFDLRETVRETFRLFELPARQKGLRLSMDIDPDCPANVQGDAVRLQQVLTNLLGNALKFTSAGEISLKLNCLPSPVSGMVRLLFSIRDTGLGIADETLSRLFKPFTQADDSYTRAFQGAGLGLAIAKRILDMMGGSMSVESEQGAGSTFHVRVDLHLPPTEPPPEAEAKSDIGPDLKTRPQRVLVVEDETVNRLVLARLLGKMGFSVETAENGSRAVDMVCAQPYDAVLMDIQMPVMNGLEATREIRRREEEAGGPMKFANAKAGKNGEVGRPEKLPIIAVTAHAMLGDREKFLAAGMDAYLSKPVTAKELEQALLEVWNR
jgi:PAS domain S-box-containing protein